MSSSFGTLWRASHRYRERREEREKGIHLAQWREVGRGRRRRKGGDGCVITLSATTVPTQEELRKFIKFACNQERIPFGNPCREGGRDTAMNVPPYPMKIAPPDGTGEQWPPCDVVAHLATEQWLMYIIWCFVTNVVN